MPQFHKKIRLDSSVYQNPGQLCSITIGVQNRQSIFRQEAFAQASTKRLLEYATANKVRLHVFCFMPDHVHMLLEGGSSMSIIEVVGEMKGLLTKLGWQHSLQGSIFQKSFFDHFLRADEDIMTVVYYILNNPVRAGLVEHWWEYPYIGSTVYSLGDLRRSGG